MKIGMFSLSALSAGLLGCLAFSALAAAQSPGDEQYYDPHAYRSQTQPAAAEAAADEAANEAAGPSTSSRPTGTTPDNLDVNGFFPKEYYRAPSTWSKPADTETAPSRPQAQRPYDRIPAGSLPRHRVAETATSVFGAIAGGASGITSGAGAAAAGILNKAVSPNTGNEEFDQTLQACAPYRSTPFERRCIRNNTVLKAQERNQNRGSARTASTRGRAPREESLTNPNEELPPDEPINPPAN